MGKQPSLKFNFLLSTIYQILCIITPLITAPYVARVIGADGTGIYSYTNSYVTFFSLFAALGTASYGMREIARKRNDMQSRSLIFWEIELLSIITTMICVVLWGIWIICNSKYKIYYIILSLSLLAVMFDISWFYAGIERFKNMVYVNGLFKIIGVCSIFLFVKNKNDLWIYIMILSLTVFLGNLSMWIALPKYISQINIKEIRIKQHFKETLIYFIPSIATSIYTILDKTLIGLITKSEYENGYYEQAVKIINMAKMLTFTAINSVMQARISYLFAENKIEEIKERISTSMDYILFMGVGIMFGLLGVSGRFVPLFFGPGYDKTIIILIIMSPIILIIGISNCLGSQYYTPAGLRSLSARFIIIGSFVNLILNLCLIPKFKSYGATVASILAEITITALYIIYCNGFLTLKYIVKESYKKLLAGSIMLIFILYTDILVSKDIISMLIEVLGGIIVYTLTLLILKDKFVQKVTNSIFNKLKYRMKRREKIG